MKKFSIILGILLVLLFGAITTKAAGGLAIKIDSSSQTVNSSFNVGVSVTDSVYGPANVSVTDSVYGNISAIEITLKYPSDYLGYTGVSTEKEAYVVVKDLPKTDNYDEKKILIAFLGSNNALNVGDKILDLGFIAKQCGQADISMSYGLVGTGQGELITPQLESGLISITQSMDVNSDGVVNLADASIVTYNIGRPVYEYPQCDINNDGLIDRKDIEIIINYLSQ